MAQTTSDLIFEVIRKESWILDHFEIFVTIALKGAYGNRWQTEDGDATWRITLPWRRYLSSPSAFSSLNFVGIRISHLDHVQIWKESGDRCILLQPSVRLSLYIEQ